MINWSRVVLAPVTAAALIGLAACGSGAAPATPPPASAQPNAGHDMNGMQGMEGMPGMGGGPAGSLELWAVQSGPLGVVVTDGNGELIYRSDHDGSAPSASNCTGDCTATWQPLMADLNQPPSLLGVEENAVGLVKRADGGEQLTIAGWPLYRHVGEHGGLQSTEANGADGVWFAIRPDGTKAAPAAG